MDFQSPLWKDFETPVSCSLSWSLNHSYYKFFSSIYKFFFPGSPTNKWNPFVAHSSFLSIAPLGSPFIPTITLLKQLMIFTVFPNSALLCNPFQSGIVSCREIALLKSLETSILPLDISVLFLLNCLATFWKVPFFLVLKDSFLPLL